MLLDLKDGEWAAFLKKLEGGVDRTNGDFVVDGRPVPVDSWILFQRLRVVCSWTPPGRSLPLGA